MRYLSYKYTYKERFSTIRHSKSSKVTLVVGRRAGDKASPMKVNDHRFEIFADLVFL